MNRPYSALLVCALLLTGCGAGASSSASHSEEAQPVATPAVEIDTPQNTCRALFNADEGSLHETVSSFLLDVDSLDKDTAAEAEDLSTKLAAVASTADDKLADPITEMRAPLDEFVQEWDTNGTWSLDITHGAAFEETIAICEGYFPASSAAATPEPTPIPTTGDFTADAIALGTDPATIPFWESEPAVKRMCPRYTDSPKALTDYAYAIGKERGTQTGSQNNDMVRLVVQYNCPEHASALEAVFARLD